MEARKKLREEGGGEPKGREKKLSMKNKAEQQNPGSRQREEKEKKRR